MQLLVVGAKFNVKTNKRAPPLKSVMVLHHPHTSTSQYVHNISDFSESLTLLLFSLLLDSLLLFFCFFPIDCQQNMFYILMPYVFSPLPPSLNPIWPNQLCYKKAQRLHAHTQILCKLIGWSSHWSLRGLQLNGAIIRLWMTVGEGRPPLFFLYLTPRPDHVQVIKALLTFAILWARHSKADLTPRLHVLHAPNTHTRTIHTSFCTEHLLRLGFNIRHSWCWEKRTCSKGLVWSWK